MCPLSQDVRSSLCVIANSSIKVTHQKYPVSFGNAVESLSQLVVKLAFLLRWCFKNGSVHTDACSMAFACDGKTERHAS